MVVCTLFLINTSNGVFYRNLPEPLMTFELHPHFINAAKMDSKTRVSCIHYFVHKLPQIHFKMLQIIIEHLRK